MRDQRPMRDRGVTVAAVLPKDLVRFLDEEARRGAEDSYRAPSRSEVIRTLVARECARRGTEAGRSSQAA